VTLVRRGRLVAAVLVLTLLAAVLLPLRRGDPALYPAAPGAPSIEVSVVSHGYHAGLVVARDALVRTAREGGLAALGEVAERFAAFPLLEIGWGDAGFYRGVPTLADLRVVEGLRALLLPGNESVLHVVGLRAPARDSFPVADILALELGREGFAKLAREIDATLARERDAVVELGPGLYGPSAFYRAVGAFHLGNVCNHWIARLLDAAGVPTHPVLATLPQGLLLDLSWRAGAQRR
jgi:uncharacterized protein (TIGR02117 family)